jgi:hypothetical protein
MAAALRYSAIPLDLAQISSSYFGTIMICDGFRDDEDAANLLIPV